ncbi:class I SAM-dependent RNA methyltransferase [Desulfurivibrio dismutans]|uniref:class I SAM-dependent RNA methyltransferase n=1 Tax=Desulfurivibrio dismutans TaxID=1398908 RepID=UPI0023DB646E|nr:class I SAM-dependent RNA methyltransferase [Desulfurivibrio alkaliphilus]MDF1615378.1 class I SAM-dependent RNA methyltransferase [Desulfurivibrio alkaliphilus]
MLLTIEKIIAGGLGLGRREDGCTVLVPGVLPGEEVRVRVRRRHRRFLEAELQEHLRPAPARRQPPCPFYGRCGGCDLQHALYPAQLAIKQQILEELLQRVGLAAQVLPRLAAPLAAPAEFNYRQRIRLQVEQGRAGFFQSGSRQLQPISTCLLARPEINALWQEMQQHKGWRQLAGQVKALEINLDPVSGRLVVMLRHGRRPRPAERRAAWQLCRDLPALQGLAFLPAGHAAGPFIDQRSGPEGRPGPEALQLTMSLPVVPAAVNLELGFEPWGFSQVNEEQNRQLLALLFEFLQPTGREIVADLHCGMGNFSLPLALLVGEVHGVDLQAAAIRWARRNAEANRINNCYFSRAEAGQGLAALQVGGIRPDVLLLDPPRTGCKELVAALAEPLPPRIVMISCDPATMVRDLSGLLALNYQVAAMRLVDMFPQTHHIETITMLTKSQP